MNLSKETSKLIEDLKNLENWIIENKKEKINFKETYNIN
jgi:hypothetical protein